jgi:hypothetical protein
MSPALALQRANRALASVTLEHLRRGLRDGDSGGVEPVQIPVEVPPRTPSAAAGAPPPQRVEVPVLGLLPVPNLAIRGATVELTWECAGTAGTAGDGGSGAAARRRLVGEPGAPRARTRPGNRALKVDLRLSLREGSPTEGALRVQDRLNTLGWRPAGEGGGATR